MSLRTMLTKDFELLVSKYKPDIIFLQEIKIKKEIDCDILKSYPYRIYNFGSFGVCCWSKIKPLSFEIFDGRLIKLIFPDFDIINVYAQNAGMDLQFMSKKMEWTKSLSSFIDRETILCGDINVVIRDNDIWNTKNTNRAGYTFAEREDFISLMNTYRLKILPATGPKYTYYSFLGRANKEFFDGESNKGWRLDYFLTNFTDLKTFKVRHITWPGSDHLPIILTHSTDTSFFTQPLSTVKFRETSGTRQYRQSKRSDEKPMYKMFEYADYHRHTIYISLQTSEMSYEFLSFKDKSHFESWEKIRERKPCYEILRENLRCKLYFDIDKQIDLKKFIKSTLLTNDYLIKKGSVGYHIIFDKWFINNEVMKEYVNKCDKVFDQKVYTKNRLMRLLGSAKFGGEPFVPIDINNKILEDQTVSDYFIGYY